MRIFARSIALCAVFVTGCSVTETPEYDSIMTSEAPAQHGNLSTAPVLLVADCQFHNLQSRPVTDRDRAADWFASTAVRPPQLDMFSPAVLEWILRNSAEQVTYLSKGDFDPRGDRKVRPTRGILHLGDGLNMSCQNEFERLVEVMGTSRLPWLMAPGNHDGYYLGNYHPLEGNDSWSRGCHHSRLPNETANTLDKAKFIRFYVASLIKQQFADDPTPARTPDRNRQETVVLDVSTNSHVEHVATIQAFVKALKKRAPKLRGLDLEASSLAQIAATIPGRFEWKSTGETTGLLRAVAWRIDKKRPWRSFIVQQADLGPVRNWETGEPHAGRPQQLHVILLDSCQYLDPPVLAPKFFLLGRLQVNAGVTGALLADQLRIVKKWASKTCASKQCGLVFACHHPLDSISQNARASLKWLWRQHDQAMLFISAHTHDGHYRQHTLGPRDERLELNIGSTTDWPIEWRTLEVLQRGDRLTHMKSRRYSLADELRDRPGFFKSAWRIAPGAPDDYRAYSFGERNLFSILWRTVIEHYFSWPGEPFNTKAPSTRAKNVEHEVKRGVLLTYRRLLELFPTKDAPDTAYPLGATSDRELIALIERLAHGPGRGLDEKNEFIDQLEQFERNRKTEDDAKRLRYKVSLAAWASRDEKHKRDRLPQDELIEIRRSSQ